MAAITGREIVGLERVTYGIEDMPRALKFFDDFGLKRVSSDGVTTVYEALDGTRVVAKPANANDLPEAIQPGSTVREIVWGVRTKEDLEKFAKEIAKDRPVTRGKDGAVYCKDPMGLAIGFAKTKRRDISKKIYREQMNSPTQKERVDRASIIRGHAIPASLGHAVYNVPDLLAMEAFYIKRLGFGLSDRYYRDGKLRGLFMRCSTPGDHHNWFLMQAPDGKPQLNHVAFKVRDIHEVFAGGLDLTRKGWATEIGPGRHPISSAYFWYLKSPAGGAVEYYTDDDHLTKKWKPRKFDSVPENFAEWALPAGIAATTVDIKDRDTGTGRG
jgi:catechol 2,3-dioxygenase-like lactoylglutathione lyase family enzyme